MEKLFTIKTSLKLGWSATKKHFLIMVGLYLAYVLMYSLISWPTIGTPPFSSTYNVGLLIQALLGIIFSVGYLKISLQAVDGKEPSFSAYGETLPRIVPYLITSLLTMIGTLLGMLLLIIPGFYFIIRAQFAYYFVIEGYGPIDSIKKSWQITQGHTLRLLGQLFVMIGITLLGLLALIVGVFAAVVWIQLIYASTYRLLQAEYGLKTENTTETPETDLQQ